jgi:pantetheine-phosphate adenylyltransferase
MRVAVYAGSFDPITLGHMDIITKAADDFDTVNVVVMRNPNKKATRSAEFRADLIEKSISNLYYAGKNVFAIYSYFDDNCLTANVAYKLSANVLIRGVKGVTNLEEEMQLAFNNQLLNDKIHTVWYPVNQEHWHVSSSAVREILRCTDWLYQDTNKYLEEKLKHYLPHEIIETVIKNRQLFC